MEIKIPQLGVTMTEGEITEWLVENGASVTEGEPIYNLATDKTEAEIEAPSAGTIEIFGEIDTTYQVGTVVGIIRQ
ncbi:biotin/lipoyl-containing protein [Nocardia jiangxiensis]|uniref:Biotin/lipoyl-containing protein n=1 Tax=Nocardia jiangxiensis TaxID=282685 RepID=A0ABW6SAH4_9NOCA|nr:biotin/lipoyl-containing protein [Nocardia jiangxiensis]